MDQLIKIENTTIGDACVPTVNARELHEFLESKQKFSDWIKKRIEKLRLLENKDFCTASQTYETANGGYSSRLEYFLSLEIAKHVALMENTDRGFEVREYFIECEKQLRTLVTHKEGYFLDILRAEDDVDRVLAVRKLDQAIIKPLEQFKEQALPKVDFYDIAVASSSTIDIGEAAKIPLFEGPFGVLKYQEIGRNNLFKFLRREGVLMKNNTPKQEYVNKGWWRGELSWFKIVEYKVNGEVKIKTLVHLSALPVRKSGMSLFRGDYQKGLDGIRKMLNEAGLLPEDR